MTLDRCVKSFIVEDIFTANQLTDVLLPGTAQPHDGPSAAVAAAIHEGERGAELLFIERSAQQGDSWSGQMAFPGGRTSSIDVNSIATAIRETKEEAGAAVIAGEDSLYTLFNLPAINQVYLFFRVELANLEFSPGIESEEVALFSESKIPWEEIAFPVVKTTLKQYFQDSRSNKCPVRMFDVHYDQNRKISTKMISNSAS